jgi:hypothetical protein
VGGGHAKKLFFTVNFIFPTLSAKKYENKIKIKLCDSMCHAGHKIYA